MCNGTRGLCIDYGMATNWPSMRENFKWRLQAAYTNWRGLDKPQQWLIAGGLLGVAAVSMAIALFITLRPKAATGPTSASGGEVVLYTSVDDFVARPVIDAFEKASGIKVKLVTDTEATKTTGLIERLLAEREAPRADVWWSSELVGTQILDKSSVLEPFAPRAQSEFAQGWPGGLRAADGAWYGVALRARVIVYSTNRLSKQTAPTKLRELTDPKWSGRVGIARPQFGTTRTHVAYLIAEHGEDAVRLWLMELVGNGVRLYDGNASVVRAVAFGEIDVGLTDTDDVYVGKDNQWPVEMAFETADKITKGTMAQKGLPSAGTLVIPFTIAKVRGGPNPNQAARLASFLVSAEAERLLATGPSKNIPIRDTLAKELKMTPIPMMAPIDAKALEASIGKADALLNEIFPLLAPSS